MTDYVKIVYRFWPSIVEDKATRCLKLLVSTAPKLTSQQDKDGNFPLNLALKARRTLENGAMILINEYSEALLNVDDETMLYPFMIPAAIIDSNDTVDFANVSDNLNVDNGSATDDEDDNSILSTIFFLLRKEPSVISTIMAHNNDQTAMSFYARDEKCIQNDVLDKDEITIDSTSTDETVNLSQNESKEAEV